MRPGFTLTPDTLPAVAAICRRLDGLPLAIELVAARLRLASPAALAARLADGLEQSLQLLSDGPVDAPDRQRTMRAAVLWSCNLLSTEERTLFARLSVFAGGWTIAAAEAIVPVEEQANVFITLAALVEHALVLPANDTTEAHARFRFLVPVAAVARVLMDERSDGEATRAGHASYYRAFVGEISDDLRGAGRAALLQRCEDERDNITGALTWAVRTGTAPVALALVAGAWRFWAIRGYLRDGRAWCAQVLEREASSHDDAVSRSDRAEALNGAGVLAYLQDDHAQAAAALEDSLALRRAEDNPRALASTLTNLANVEIEQGHDERALLLLEECLVLHRTRGDRRREALILNNMGEVARLRGDLALADATHGRALELRRFQGDVTGAATSAINLAHVALARGAIARAMDLYRQGLAVRDSEGDERGTAVALIGLAEATLAHGNPAAAAGLWRRGITLFRRLDDRRGLVEAVEGVAALALACGAGADALLLSDATTMARSMLGTPRGVTDAARAESVRARAHGASHADARVMDPLDLDAALVLALGVLDTAYARTLAETSENAHVDRDGRKGTG